MTSITITQEALESKNKFFGFQYPTKALNFYWEWPWNVNGGFFSWIYKKWEVKNKRSKTIWRGRIILGFKKISITYSCGPIEAYLIWLENNRNFAKNLMKFLKEEEKERLVENFDNISGNDGETMLFK